MAAVREAASLTGWLTYHTFDSRRSASGFPDLILCRGARLVAAELKGPTGRVTREQAMWLDALDAAGVECFVWRPSDWPEIEAVLARRAA
jgi:hypothetical protein